MDAAHAALMLEAARAYGLVKGGPKVNVERCEEILTRGEARQVRPSEYAAQAFIFEINEQHRQRMEEKS